MLEVLHECTPNHKDSVLLLALQKDVLQCWGKACQTLTSASCFQHSSWQQLGPACMRSHGWPRSSHLLCIRPMLQ